MLANRDLLSITDLEPRGLARILETSLQLKDGDQQSVLTGQTLALVFEKPSLRTRVSFNVAAAQLGGYCLYLSPQEVGLGNREPVRDVARSLSRYVDCIAARTFAHSTVTELARWSEVPVINALSEEEHPCQALADLLTIQEKTGRLSGVILAYVGDGNNVARSLCLGAALAGMEFRIASPPGYNLSPTFVQRARDKAREFDSRAILTTTADPVEAVSGADIVYTDVWASMGQENEASTRRKAFGGYQVTMDLLAVASPKALFMHDLPAHRDEEVTDEVIESKQSVVFDQAENRLHVQKALLALMLDKEMKL